MNRDNVQAEFISRFGRESSKESVSDEEIHEYSNELQTTLPESYVSFTKKYGSVVCDGMLESIVKLEIHLWDVMKIESPKEAKESTKVFWSGGMSTDYVAFGSDSMGNAFCFEKTKEKKDDSAVYLFDHDFDEMEKLTDGFDLWLSKYLELIPNKT